MKLSGENPVHYGAGLLPDQSIPTPGLHDAVGVRIAEELRAEGQVYGPARWSPQAAWEGNLALQHRDEERIARRTGLEQRHDFAAARGLGALSLAQ